MTMMMMIVMMMTSKPCQNGDEDYNCCNNILNFAAYIVVTIYMGSTSPLKIEENEFIVGLKPLLAWCVKELVQGVCPPEKMVEQGYQTKVDDTE